MTDPVNLPYWRFVEHFAEAKSRDPLQSELLNLESFRPADALVRESIQNSLDAKLPGSGQVRVRIYVSGNAAALSREEAAPYFGGFWPHVAQCEGGGQVTSALASGPCRFVVIEDFGTSGLTGDPAAARVAEGVSNNYYYFLRAEGISKKESSNLGRWGVGKYVFPKTSGVNAFIAYTRRAGESGSGLLVGQAVLMNHSLDGKDYDPDGWWAKPGPGFQMPITNPEIITETSTRWNIRRREESGLSIVIPYVDESVSGTAFVQAVIRAYFGALLAGKLEVEVDDPSGAGLITMNSDNVLSLAETYFEAEEREKVVGEVQLLMNRSRLVEANRFTINPVAAGSGKGWSSETIDSEAASQMRGLIESGQTIEVTVPIELRMKTAGTSQRNQSHFHVLLQQNEASRQKPLYMRGGIIISEASRTSIPGIRAICMIEDAPLTKMLGDAENPAHTTWTANDKIRSRYIRGNDLLLLVKSAPHRIHQLILDSALEGQRIIFADIFSVPVGDPEAGRKRRVPPGRGGPGGKRRRPGSGGTGRPALTRVEKEQQGGFSVVATEHGKASNLKQVDVSLGYATRRGDALSKWRKEDFDLSTFAPVITGGSIGRAANNTLSVAVDDPASFKLTLLGFDTNRDLEIRTRGHSK